MKWVIVDVGCIECGEQTEVLGVFDDEIEAKKAFEQHVESRGIKKWQPRGGFLEMLGLHGHTETTFIGGAGYFVGGQRTLELHVLPAIKIEQPEAQPANAAEPTGA